MEIVKLISILVQGILKLVESEDWSSVKKASEILVKDEKLRSRVALTIERAKAAREFRARPGGG